MDYEQVREKFNYHNGELIWRYSPSNNTPAGSVAGSLNSNGYLLVSVNDITYRVHRLIWLWHYGYLPENDIDHINRDKSYNFIENLREVSRQCNMRNIGNLKNNTSGVKGVYWNKQAKKWKVQIKVYYKTYGAGYYNDFDNAVCARLAAEQCLGWQGCDSASPAYKYVQKMLE